MEPRQGTLLIWFVLIICLVFITFFSKRLPLVEGVVVVLHVAGFFAVIIPLWVVSERDYSKQVCKSLRPNTLTRIITTSADLLVYLQLLCSRII